MRIRTVAKSLRLSLLAVYALAEACKPAAVSSVQSIVGIGEDGQAKALGLLPVHNLMSNVPATVASIFPTAARQGAEAQTLFALVECSGGKGPDGKARTADEWITQLEDSARTGSLFLDPGRQLHQGRSGAALATSLCKTTGISERLVSFPVFHSMSMALTSLPATLPAKGTPAYTQISDSVLLGQSLFLALYGSYDTGKKTAGNTGFMEQMLQMGVQQHDLAASDVASVRTDLGSLQADFIPCYTGTAKSRLPSYVKSLAAANYKCVPATNSRTLVNFQPVDAAGASYTTFRDRLAFAIAVHHDADMASLTLMKSPVANYWDVLTTTKPWQTLNGGQSSSTAASGSKAKPAGFGLEEFFEEPMTEPTNFGGESETLGGTTGEGGTTGGYPGVGEERAPSTTGATAEEGGSGSFCLAGCPFVASRPTQANGLLEAQGGAYQSPAQYRQMFGAGQDPSSRAPQMNNDSLVNGQFLTQSYAERANGLSTSLEQGQADPNGYLSQIRSPEGDAGTRQAFTNAYTQRATAYPGGAEAYQKLWTENPQSGMRDLQTSVKSDASYYQGEATAYTNQLNQRASAMQQYANSPSIGALPDRVPARPDLPFYSGLAVGLGAAVEQGGNITGGLATARGPATGSDAATGFASGGFSAILNAEQSNRDAWTQMYGQFYNPNGTKK